MQQLNIWLTGGQLEALLQALQMSHAFAVYGDGRDAHQATIEDIIAKIKGEL